MPHIRLSSLPRRGALLVASLVALASCDRLTGGEPETEAKPAASTPAETKPEAEPAEAPPKEAKPEAITAQTVAPKPVAAPVAADGSTPMVNPQATPAASTPAVAAPPPEARTLGEQNTIAVFKAAAPATVFVTQTQVVQNWSTRTLEEAEAGAGTGFIWDAEGHIVTNCHVALADCSAGRPPRRLSVTLYDQKTYDAKLIGSDPYKDIAVLKIEPDKPLVPIRRVPSGYELVVGQKTIAIGNPFGLDHTLTTGVISAMGREVQGIGGVTIRDMVQTDAAINPGNSGGPLLDSRGQLIGMNTMIFSSSGSSAGIGFAVPQSVIQRVVPQIITNGRPTRIGLGVSILDPAVARRMGVEGVVVDRVGPSSPAGKAGLRSATRISSGWALDVVVGVDGDRVKSYDDLYNALETKAAGDKVSLSVLRLPGDEVVTIETELIEL